MPGENLYISSLSHQLGAALTTRGILSLDQLDIAIKEQVLQGVAFEECLLNLGFISEGVLAEVLSSLTGFEQINLASTLLDPSLKSLISRENAERYSLLPLSLEKGVLRVAIADVYNMAALDFLRASLSAVQKVVPLIALESQILEAIDQYYGYDMSIRGLLKEIESAATQSVIHPIIRLINTILVDGIKQKASDIHFEPEGVFVRLRYRIDGLLVQICTLHASYWPPMCVRLKVMSEMNIAEGRKPQNGRMTFSLGPREIDLRVASHPTIHGENIVVRILDKSRSLLNLDELGYSKNVIKSLKRGLRRPEGIFILTGPTGCGKTTSLYSVLAQLSTPALNIMTLEEPVEYTLPLIRQSDIRELGGLDFAEGVRSILRQDPDIILIGEIRDPPTAQMALRASMTGHQVFSTLHTNDALGAIHRLVDLGLSRVTLAGNLTALIAQRLVRKLCASCKQAKPMTFEEKELLKPVCPTPLFVPQGCQECRGTGYRGRKAFAEVLVFDEAPSEILISSSSRKALKEAALTKGYVPMAVDARDQVLEGETSLAEVLRVIDLRESHDPLSI